MALRLVLGRAGSGKTRFCLEEIRAALAEGPAGPALILLTPEQATLQMEMDLHRVAPGPGFSRAQVLSFRRLGWRVFQEAGGAAREHLGEMGKRMALRAILQARQGDLTLFASLAGSPGFIEQLAHTVAELKLYRVEPVDLERLADDYRQKGQGDTILGRKLHDLALIYGELEHYLAGRYLDPDDYLALLARRLPEASFIKGALIWVDGFNGFTPQEEGVLQALMAAAGRVTVTLCLDPSLRHQKLGETELFHSTAVTCQRLRHLALATGVNMEPDLALRGTPPRFQAAPALAHLEAFFGRWPLQPFNGPPDGIRLVAAANRRVEVEAAAREILRLARDEGLRCREMAVLVRDLEPYHDLIVNIFRDLNIPFFIDRRRPVGHHPLIELVRAALETVLENWAYDPVFRYLKSDLVPVARRIVDRLENYVLAHGIRGRQWLDERPWTFRSGRDPAAAAAAPVGGQAAGVPDNLDPALAALNRYRRGATAHLQRLHRAVQGRTLTVREITAALFNLLQELRVPRILAAWRCRALATGELDAAQEHEQVWDGLMDLFDELITGLGDTPLGLEEYAAILDAGMEGLKLRLIPPALDQVVVGTLDRSRQPELQAALVLGVGEGVLPARLPEDATFSDREREELQAAGLELAPTGSLRLYHEEYLAYLALTRSQRFLWLSYPLADHEGRALAPSPLVRRLRQLLPQLPEESAGLDLPGGAADLEYVTTPRQAAGYLARLSSHHQELPPLWQEVYRWLAAHREASRWLGLLRGTGYRNQVEPLAPEVVALLFPQPLHTSISRLETYAACPFRYFLAYGLGLREREVYQVDPADMGQFYHAALKLFVEELQARGLNWGSLSDQEEAALLDRVVAALVPALQHEILSSSARYGYLRRQLTRTLERVLGVLGEHARRGEFRPLLVEAAFGRGGELPPLELEVAPGQRVILAGRVDRIDVANLQGQIYLRVIDYKSSQTDVNLERVYYGLSLQLPLYLEAALAAAPCLLGTAATPAGILYFAVRNPVIRRRLPVRGEAEVAKLHRQELKMRGLILDEPEVIRLMDREVERNPDLLPVRLNKDGRPRKGAPVTGREEMALLLKLARARAAGLAASILAGRVDIRPYRQGTRSGCEYCPYHPVCGFDLQLPGPAYRRLGVLQGEDFWQAARHLLNPSL
ncbi:helicase-exonuclease AddAB subunit AddB [Moorella naiadis]|uniref:helicase-exonuclease AddAB subunit AddB n=1 Tax=Moorella naiadis (nom. illeg.) TaxID=3093670 RepID=UPI003D9C8F1E